VRPGLRLALLAGALAALFAIVLITVPRDAGELRAALESPPVYVLAAAALTVGFFPFPVVAAAGGLLFGVGAGTLLATLAETLGAVTALLVARFAARDAAAQLVRGRVRDAVDAVAARGFAAVLLVRVLPGVPRHPANYAFGLTAVGVAPFTAATALGTAPRAFAYAALGGTLGDLGSPESIAAIALLVVLGVAGVALAARARAAGPGTGSSSPDARSAGPR